MIIIILLRVKNSIEIETHNYLIHVPLYKKLQNLNEVKTLHAGRSQVVAAQTIRIFGRPFLRKGLCEMQWTLFITGLRLLFYFMFCTQMRLDMRT